MTVFLVITPCRVKSWSKPFQETCYFHLYGDNEVEVDSLWSYMVQ